MNPGGNMKPGEQPGIDQAELGPQFIDAKGKPIDVPPEGALWLLAVGWRGVVAWRRARERAGIDHSDHLVYIEPEPEKK